MGELRFIDLFAGIGGFRLGLERCNDKENWEQIQGSQDGQKEVGDTGDEFLRANGDNGCGGQSPEEHNRFHRGLERANKAIYNKETQEERDQESWGASADINREPSTFGRRKPSDGGFGRANSDRGLLQRQEEKGLQEDGANFERRQAWINGFKCVWSNDINKYANQVYTARFGEANHHSGDIRGIDAKDIPGHDLLCGGFPCQAFSVAGKRRGFKETRGTLFFEICRIAEYHRPRLLLLENVKGLLSNDGGRTFATILEALEELGYWWEYQVLNSKHFGVPQNRERVFIIGHSRNSGTRPIFPITEADGVADQGIREEGEYSTAIDSNYYKGIDKHGQRQGIIVESALIHSRGLETRRDGVSHCLKGGGGGSSKNMLVEPYIKNIPHGHNDGWKKPLPSLKSNSGAQYNELLVQPVLTPDRENKRQHGRRFKENGEPMFTLTGQDKHGVLLHNIYGGFNEGIRVFEDYSPTIRTPKGGGHLPSVLKDSRIRRLTPCECERLQGFPDGWTEGISDTQRYKCLGNAVTVNVIEFLGHKLLESVNSTSKRLKENVFVDLDFKDVEIRVK